MIALDILFYKCSFYRGVGEKAYPFKINVIMICKFVKMQMNDTSVKFVQLMFILRFLFQNLIYNRKSIFIRFMIGENTVFGNENFMDNADQLYHSNYAII